MPGAFARRVDGVVGSHPEAEVAILPRHVQPGVELAALAPLVGHDLEDLPGHEHVFQLDGRLVRDDAGKLAVDRERLSHGDAVGEAEHDPGLPRPVVLPERVAEAQQGRPRPGRVPQEQADGRGDQRDGGQPGQANAARVDDAIEVTALGQAHRPHDSLAAQHGGAAGPRLRRLLQELDGAGQRVVQDGGFVLDPQGQRQVICLGRQGRQQVAVGDEPGARQRTHEQERPHQTGQMDLRVEQPGQGGTAHDKGQQQASPAPEDHRAQATA